MPEGEYGIRLTGGRKTIEKRFMVTKEKVSIIKKKKEIEPVFRLIEGEILGRIAMKSNDYPEAIEAYVRYCELRATESTACNLLADAYFKNEDYENALNTLRKSQSLAPDNPMIYKIKGLIYIRQNQNEKGCNNLFRALQLGYLEQYGYDLLVTGDW